MEGFGAKEQQCFDEFAALFNQWVDRYAEGEMVNGNDFHSMLLFVGGMCVRNALCFYSDDVKVDMLVLFTKQMVNMLELKNVAVNSLSMEGIKI